MTLVYADGHRLVVEVLRDGTLERADAALAEEPVTVTASRCLHSPGGRHDFYSEADYWWPDPADPHGPYIRRDGLTNPDNFVAHRHAMVRMARLVGVLASAYRLTGDDRYAAAIDAHAHAWFVEPGTAMAPHLRYAQAIRGRDTGRGIGIIDTLHLIEVTQGLRAVEGSPAVSAETLAGVRRWFGKYLHWLTTHPHGLAERAQANNHGTCWLLQAAAFARFAGACAPDGLLAQTPQRFAELLDAQMAADGSFPLELARTKPYGYSIFNADAFATISQLISVDGPDLWRYRLDDGRDLARAFEFVHPYLADKASWPYPPDVLHFDEWPVASPGLLFAALAYGRRDWLYTWRDAAHWPTGDEVLRNLPVRNPLLWLAEPLADRPGQIPGSGRRGT